jgi:hypothetical protein
VEDFHVIDELGHRIPRLALRRLVEQNVRDLGITDSDHPDLVGFDLEHAFDGAFSRMLQSDDSRGL